MLEIAVAQLQSVKHLEQRIKDLKSMTLSVNDKLKQAFAQKTEFCMMIQRHALLEQNGKTLITSLGSLGGSGTFSQSYQTGR